MWYGVVAGEGLRSVGADGELPIQERVLYPAPRSPFTGRGSHTSQAGYGAPALIMLLAALFSLFPTAFGAAFALPRPEALSPPALTPAVQILCAYTQLIECALQGQTSPAALALSGRGMRTFTAP